MCFLDLLIFVGWKVAKRTSFRRAAEMDFVSDMVELKVYEQECASSSHPIRADGSDAAEVSSRPDTQNLNMFQRLNARVVRPLAGLACLTPRSGTEPSLPAALGMPIGRICVFVSVYVSCTYAP